MEPLADLGRPPAIPEEALADVQLLLTSGRLHRYAEKPAAVSHVALLERAFADATGRRYAVAVNSCGSAMFLALKGAGIKLGDLVLMNAFTLGPVPGAVDHIGAKPVLVEITENLTIDMDDLRAKARATGARHLLLSHMRGHICDMDALVTLCAEESISLIEDCAHTQGAFWSGRPSGSFGLAGCFSFQSAKHVNAGEGGMLVTDDPDLAARAILHSGSYMLYGQNGTLPPDDVMGHWKTRCANYSLRMSNLVAALVLPQLPLIAGRVADWNASYDRMAARLAGDARFQLPERPQAEAYAQSSLQFRLPAADAQGIARYVAAARSAGVMVKWFGTALPEGYTSAPPHWIGADASLVPRACVIQATLCDIRIPLGLHPQDCDRIVDVLIAAASELDLRRDDYGRA